MGAGFLAVAGVSGAAAVLVVGHSATPTSTHLAQSPAAVIRPVSGPNGDNARQVYDSAKDGRARFTPHTSFEDPNTPPGAPPRQSIEARAIAFFQAGK